jgi:NAD(P)-dependent dehydrogenase (short-subunit alcohol dehydrogenase family)
MSLQDRVVVIAGATGHLGRKVAHRFAAQGARLALLGTNEERLRNLVRELKLTEAQSLTHVADLRDAHSVKKAAAAIQTGFGRIDILLNLVGGWAGGKPLTEVSERETIGMLDQHVWTTFHLIQAFVPLIVANKWGRVIVVSSPHALRPPAHSGPYAMAKSAQEVLMLTLAQEVKDTGVTANILQVRSIAKPDNSKPATGTMPEEIASTILFLCSDDAHAVNGARIPLYGSQ